MDAQTDPARHHFPLPDYRGGSIVNLMRSLQLGLGAAATAPSSAADYPALAALPPETVASRHRVVLLIIDGLGHDFLSAQTGSFLHRHLHCRLSSVFPTTTASAITTYHTGLAPQQHGLTGWFIWLRELGSVTAILPFRPRYGGPGYAAQGVEPRAIFDSPPLADTLGVPTTIVTQDWLADSVYSLATAGNTQRIGYADMDELFAAIRSAVTDPGERRFVYAYWPGLDSKAHKTGANSAQTLAHFQALDAGIEALARSLDALPGGADTLLLVCADHGFTDIDPARRVWLEDHPRLANTLALPLCGEPRAAYCYLKPGRTREFVDYVQGELTELCTPVPAAQLLEEGWFGLGSPHPRLHERIGDYVLMMHAGAIIKDRLLGEAAFEMRGVHGGLSPEELYVPLISYQTGNR